MFILCLNYPHAAPTKLKKFIAMFSINISSLMKISLKLSNQFICKLVDARRSVTRNSLPSYNKLTQSVVRGLRASQC